MVVPTNQIRHQGGRICGNNYHYQLFWKQSSAIIRKSYFSRRGSRPLATEVNCFQLSNIVTKGSILVVADVLDSPLIKIFTIVKIYCTSYILLMDTQFKHQNSRCVHNGSPITFDKTSIINFSTKQVQAKFKNVNKGKKKVF